MILPDKPAQHPQSVRWCPACQGVTAHEFICGAWRCTQNGYHIGRVVYADGARWWYDPKTGEQTELPIAHSGTVG